MITTAKIYEKTNQGLDIILEFVPQAYAAVDNPKKTAFKYRPSERTPSAYLLAPDDKYLYWRLIDFGISQKPYSPIELYLREKNMPQNQFVKALYELAEKYCVDDDKITEANRPVWHERAAEEGECEGQRVFKTRESFTENEIKLWGPNVTDAHLRTYGCEPLLYVGTVKNGRVKECHSTDGYPMFIFRCEDIDDEGNEHIFYRLYKPREFNKRLRFEIIGQCPKNYIYGLEALKRAFRKNGEKKLDYVFLVSGFSDAVNCLSMGGQAVCLNSETSDLTGTQHKLLYEYANRIFYIGDIDATGKECSRRLALRFMDIYIVTLPEHRMQGLHDNRGNQRKDLKDYIQIYPNWEDFCNLINQARKTQFWSEEKDKDGKVVRYNISTTSFMYFLELQGFYTIHDERHERPRYIHVDGILVKEVYPKDIKNFINEWCFQNALPEKLKNVMHRCKELPNKETSNLRELNPSFSSATSTSQICYFRNVWVEVTAKGITGHSYKEHSSSSTYVWHHDIIQHDYVEHEPMFEFIEYDDGTYGATLTEHANSDVLTYLHHTSRLYWRQRDEQGLPLSEEQKRNEERCLAAKIACVGYYLHRFHSESMALAAMLQDSYLAENEKECNGRSGKSFFFNFLTKLIHCFFIDARNPDIVKDKFLFDGVTEATDLVIVDECARTLQYSCFFGKITGPFRGEEKGNHPFEIPFAKAPKMIFGTNYVIKNTDSSTEARLWPQVFSDYYHAQASNNDYHESRSIRDDFGYNLLDSDYPEEKWQADISFAMQCLRQYLSLPPSRRKVMPPMDTIQRRVQRAVIGKDFEEWAEDYYQTGGGHLDVTEDYDVVRQDYKNATGCCLESKSFTRKLKEYCSCAEHILCYNPAEHTEEHKDGGRIRERKPGDSSKRISKIHIRSVKWSKENTSSKSEKTTQLSFFGQTQETTDLIKDDFELDIDDKAPF